jgi:hypothetical protein
VQGIGLPARGQVELLGLLQHALQLGFGLGELQLRDVAHALLVLRQGQGLFARLHGGLGDGALLLQRAQAHVGLRRGGGHSQGHGAAVGLGGLQAFARGLALRRQAAPQVRLPSGLQAGLHGARVRGAEGAQAAAGLGGGGEVQAGAARGVGGGLVGACLLNAGQGGQQVVVVRQGFGDQRVELRIAQLPPPCALDGVAIGRGLAPGGGQRDLGVVGHGAGQGGAGGQQQRESCRAQACIHGCSRAGAVSMRATTDMPGRSRSARG